MKKLKMEIKPRIVYKLVRTDKPEDGFDVYVGSTSLSLTKRLGLHIRDAKVSNGNKLHKKMLEVGLDKWKIVPLLLYTCDKETILRFERSWIKILKADLNSKMPLKENSLKAREAARNFRRASLETKRYYCNVCNKSFCHIFNLKRHFNSLKHQHAYLNSLD